jgi:predicted Ser/Thr protein kinase
MMTPEQRRRVRDLFEAAFDAAPSDPAAWVAREAADDPAVLDELLSLVAHHARAGAFLAQPIAESTPDLLAEADDPATPGLNDGLRHADQPLPAGTTVGSYTIVRELGRGGMGRVYLANDARLGRTVALKALAPPLMRDPSQRERLRREARAAASLTHPGICTVYALEEIDGDLYIATEYVDGHTLGEEIRRDRRPTRDEILRTARDVAAALASAHASGIVHRDLKPENVMRARDGRLKILDFGLARILNDTVARHLSGAGSAAQPGAPYMTRAGIVVGTPAYMAPEQINGQPADARADVFAFGVLIYEYCCGAHPFAATTELATVARVLESDARPIASRCADIPPRVAEVIARCLRKVPSERFTSAAEIVGALETGGEIAPVASPHATWWRVHQITVAVLYIVAATLAWQIKDWIETPVTVSIFLALGAGATIGGVLRGHLVFTELMNRAHLRTERRRTAHATRILDAMTSILLFVDAVILAATRALPAVFTIALALGIALAAIVLEPATTAAAFEEES